MQTAPEPMAEQAQVADAVPTVEAQQTQNDDIQTSLEEVWYLKEVSFKPVADEPPRRYKVITQNFNGSVRQSSLA